MGRTAKKEKPPFAKNLMAIRKSKGFKSGEVFAKHAGIPWSTYRQYEAGVSEGTPTNRQFLAQKLGVPVSAFYEDSTPESKGMVPSDLVKTLIIAAQSQSETPTLPKEELDLLRFFRDAGPDGKKAILRSAEAIFIANQPKNHSRTARR